MTKKVFTMTNNKEQSKAIYRIFFLGIFCYFSFAQISFSASVTHVIEENLRSKEIKVTFLLDAKNESLNAYEGEIIYDTKKLSLERIETANSLVTTWITLPEKGNSLLGDDTILFEGLTPGGFEGVLGVGENNKEPGILFAAIFSLKEEGNGEVRLSRISVYKNDGTANVSDIIDYGVTLSPTVSFLASSSYRPPYTGMRQENDSISDIFAEIVTHEDVYGGKPFLIFENRNKQKSIKRAEVSESLRENPRSIKDFSWTEAKSPYLLTQMQASKYIHIRAEYTDGTYSYKTLETVEKGTNFSQKYYILILSIVLILLIIYAIRNKQKKE